MNQVQIRQIPLTASTDTQRVVGSWFPTGYYGHFRAKSRTDLCHYFRQLARPISPKKFLDRQNTEATSHLFSQHDNRSKFECDPLVRGAQMGYGKRRSETNIRGEFDPLFISWVPKNIDRKTYIDDSKITSYDKDYNHGSTSSQILSDIQSNNSLSSLSNVSVYSSVYKHGQPNHQQSKQIRQETFQRFATNQTRRSKLQRNERSRNVASCLVWNNINDENKITRTNIVTPIILQPRINSSVTSTITNQQKLYPSQSMQTFTTMEQLHPSTPTSREHFKVITPSKAATSSEQTHTNSMKCLISKYM